MIRRLIVRLALLAVCYLFASMTQVNHVIYTLVKDNYFFYQTVFYASMLLLSLVVVPVKQNLVRRPLALSLGPVIGYFSGLVAFFLMPLRGAGVGRLLEIRDLSVGFLVSPCFTFAWLVGFYFVLLIVFLGADGRRRTPRDNTLAATDESIRPSTI